MNWDYIRDPFFQLVAKLEEWSFFTSEESIGIIFLVVIITMLILVGMYSQLVRTGFFRTACVSLLVPLSAGLLSLTPQSFSGNPDDNCHRYEGGKLVFTYLASFEVPMKAEKPYGDGWFIIIVRATKRWGEDPHQCRLALAHGKARELKRRFGSLSRSYAEYSKGAVTFTFGGKRETPNVTWIPKGPALKKPYPPEQRKPEA